MGCSCAVKRTTGATLGASGRDGWLVTGRGPFRWWFRPEEAFVNPFPRGVPPDVREALEAMKERGRAGAEGGCADGGCAVSASADG